MPNEIISFYIKSLFISGWALIKDDTGHSSVEAFNDTMQKMGEPFINGYDNIEEVLPNMNLAVAEVADTGSILSDPKPIYELY
jgi:hypothetical protein